MRHKILSPMLFLTVFSLFIPPAEAASTYSRWPGASCQSIDNSNGVIFNTAGTVLNDSTTAHTVICPVQMPAQFNPGDTISVAVKLETSAATVCILRLADLSGATQESDSGTSSSQATVTLVIENDFGAFPPYSANLRCALPAASAILGAQGVVSYLVEYSD